jgi:hypothetical protein
MQLSLDHRTNVVAAAKLIMEHNNLYQRSARLLVEMPQMSKMVQLLELLQVWELLPIWRLLRCRSCTWMKAQSRSIIGGRSRSLLEPSTGLLQQCGFVEDTPTHRRTTRVCQVYCQASDCDYLLLPVTGMAGNGRESQNPEADRG